jgi:Zn-dependent metalloprotease/subtilisin-like proprotein convertase family protein
MMKRLSGAQQQATDRIKQFDPQADFFRDEQSGSVKFIKGKLSSPAQYKPEAIAQTFLQDNAGLLDLQSGLKETLALVDVETDQQGFSHVSLAQSLNGIPVFEGSTQIHLNPAGEVIAYKDYRIAQCDVSMEPRITEAQAIEIFLKDCAINSASIAESKTRLILFRDAARLVHLAWEIEWLQEGEMASSLHVVDAHAGNILLKHSRIRGVVSRLTYTANNTVNLRAELLLEDNQDSADAIAQAAHDHGFTVYNYFLDTFGRDSYDGSGADLVSSVHFKQDYNNAYWTDWYRQMVYGDGDGIRFAPLALALDVVGHELTHAVSSRTARFVYAEQAGALDESFADFFGVMVTNDGEITDWKMGEGVYTPFRSGDALRDLADPTKYGQPDHMNDFLALQPGEQPDRDKNDHGYVHSNSGIPNKAAFLTVTGDTHHGIAVQGIGRDKAEQVYYLAMTSYLNSATDSRWTFMQARYALLNACRQLYGDQGDEYAGIKNAWAAVGVGEPASEFTIVRNESSPYLAIPDNQADGVDSIIYVAEEGVLKDIYVGIAIEHTYIGDLRVVLRAPGGESVVLHDREGGASHDITSAYDLDSIPGLRGFVGDPVTGNWSLSVSDNAGVDTGKLVYWELELSLQKNARKTLETSLTPGLEIPDNNPAGIESLIEVQESGSIVKLEVVVDISHTWIGDLRVVLVAPSGPEIVLHNESGRSRHDIRKTYSSTDDESLAALLDTELQGDWRLRVIDSYSRDIGKLNAWGINCVYE